MNSSSGSDIHTLVSNFTANLTALVKRSALEHVLAALGGESTAPAKRAPGRPKGSTNAPNRGRPVGSKNKPKVRGKRTPEAVAQMGERLLSYVKAQPGRRADQIAKVFHTDVKTIRLPMLRLIAEKKMTTKGQRRGMTYFVAGAPAPAAKGKPAKKQHATKKKGTAKAKRAAKPATKSSHASAVKSRAKSAPRSKPVRRSKSKTKSARSSVAPATPAQQPSSTPIKPAVITKLETKLIPRPATSPVPTPMAIPRETKKTSATLARAVAVGSAELVGAASV